MLWAAMDFQIFWEAFLEIIFKKKQSFFESILDADNDESIIDDLVDTVTGKKNTVIVNVFGKMFNKK